MNWFDFGIGFGVGAFIGSFAFAIAVWVYAYYYKKEVFDNFGKKSMIENPEDDYSSQIKEEEKEPVELTEIKCPKCGKAFVNRGNLAMHIRFKHGEGIGQDRTA